MAGAQSWFGSEGLRAGRPYLLRGRHPASVRDERSSKAQLLCLDCPYEISDESGLPNDAQYAAFAGFEQNILGTLEDADLVLALVQTGNGRVRYYCYVADVDRIAATISQAAPFQIDLSAVHDPDWSEYIVIVQQIEGLDS